MKFNCKTQNLKFAINKTERIVSKQTSLPILGNVLIETVQGRLKIAATNLEIAIETLIGAKIEEEGKITLSAKILSGFLQNIPDETIIGEVKGNDLIIKSQKHQLKIRGMAADDFPIIPQVPAQPFFEMTADELNKKVAGILVSVANNDTRQELNGVFVEFLEDKIVLAATDSFRLTEAKIPIKVINKEEYQLFIKNTPSIIVPASFFRELIRLGEEEESFSITVEQNQIFAGGNADKLTSRLINGNYPEYKQILPAEYEINVITGKEELMRAIKITSLVIDSQNGEVRIKSEKSKQNLLISSESIDRGGNLSKVAAKVSGPDFEVVFNCRYLIDGLNVIGNYADKVLLKLNKEKSPMLIRGKDEKTERKDLSYVVMPIIKD